MNLSVSFLVSLFLLLLNAFFVLAEFAIVKVRSSQIEELTNKGSLNVTLLKGILSRLDAYLSVIQLGITMASLGLGWIAEPALAHVLAPYLHHVSLGMKKMTAHTLSFGIAFTLITFFHVVLGELAPKSIAIRAPKRAALLAAVPLNLFYRIFFLPMALLNGASNFFLRLIGFKSMESSELLHSEEELKILLSQSQERGVFSLSQLLLFENLFDFGRSRVRDVMLPIGSAATLSLAKSWEENRLVIRERKYSRYPLYGQDAADLKGYVHIKDAILKGDGGVSDLQTLRREVFYLGESDRLEKAFTELRRIGWTCRNF